MGLILNLRGTSGSGKTELARRLLAEYGWRRDQTGTLNGMEPLHWPRRRMPFAYRLRHPGNGCPLIVIGHYQVTSGGCDTIRAQDGGLPEAMRVAGDFASRGHDVLIEGLRLSSDVVLSARLAAAHRLHILLLNTSVEQCVRNLIARRRPAKRSVPAIERATAEEHRRVQEACARLGPYVTVEVLDFQSALARAQELLELNDLRVIA